MTSDEEWERRGLELRAAIEQKWARERALYAAVSDPGVRAALDVLAPADDNGDRWFGYVHTDEGSPEADEVIALAERLVQAVRGACPPSAGKD